jgi:hypothetical protein
MVNAAEEPAGRLVVGAVLEAAGPVTVDFGAVAPSAPPLPDAEAAADGCFASFEPSVAALSIVSDDVGVVHPRAMVSKSPVSIVFIERSSELPTPPARLVPWRRRG